MYQYKVGLIGCGFMGSMHADCYAALGERVLVAAVADLVPENAQKMADRFGAKIFRDAEDLINHADVDFVDICLPTYLHCEYAVMAMNKGRHVFVEKPLCLTKDEADRLIAAQNFTGKTVQVGQVIRFWDEYVWLKNAKDSGIYGKLKFLTLRRHSPRPAWAWNSWLHDPKCSGGMALDMHVHDADFARYLMGEPKKVKSAIAPEDGGLSDYIATVYDYGDAVAAIDCCWNYPDAFPFSMYFCARFENATVVHDSSRGEFVLYENGKEPKNIVIEKQLDAASSTAGGNVSSLGGYYNELKYFIDRLDDPSLPNIASLEDGARSIKLVLSEFESAKE